MRTDNPPRCAVRGMIEPPNGMCRFVIVGATHCGFRDTCEHQLHDEEPKKEGVLCIGCGAKVSKPDQHAC